VIDDGLNYARVVADHLHEYALVPGGEPAEAPRISDGPSALEFLRKHAGRTDVVLLDMHFDLPEERLLPLAEGATLRKRQRLQGLAILREIRKKFPNLPVVLLTSLDDLSPDEAGKELASQSMTYFLDGQDLDSLRVRINAALEEATTPVEETDILWGSTAAMRQLRRRLAVLARGSLPVILEGETGTGKSYLAERFIHANSGRTGPFVVVDLAAVPQDLVSAHLFGAVKGAYTGSVADRKGMFELAHQGTLFIDEVQNIPLDVQRQLLLVLQEKRVRPLGSAKEIALDVKIVAATNTSLAEAVARGRFRRDLYMRLSPATRAVIPPLRERPADVPALAAHFATVAADEPENRRMLEQVAASLGWLQCDGLVFEIGRPRERRPAGRKVSLALPDPTWKRLAGHPWPGNVRELAMVMHNLVTFTLVEAVDVLRAGRPLGGSRLQVDPALVNSLLQGYEVGPERPEATAAPGTDSTDQSFRVSLNPGRTLNDTARALESQVMVELFRRCRGDFAAMAQRLLGDRARARAVRLRFNQLGLKVRELTTRAMAGEREGWRGAGRNGPSSSRSGSR
jgi:two-component system nitrogen regulation response regulator GlnG